jgi:hypothetical protein
MARRRKSTKPSSSDDNKDEQVVQPDDNKDEQDEPKLPQQPVDAEQKQDNADSTATERRSDRIRGAKDRAKQTLYAQSVAKVLQKRKERDSKKDKGDLSPFTPGKQLDDEFFFPGMSSSDDETGQKPKKKRKTSDSTRRRRPKSKKLKREEADYHQSGKGSDDDDDEEEGVKEEDDEDSGKKKRKRSSSSTTRKSSTKTKKEPKNTALFNVSDEQVENIKSIESDVFTSTSQDLVSTQSTVRANLEALRAVMTKNYDLLKKVSLIL